MEALYNYFSFARSEYGFAVATWRRFIAPTALEAIAKMMHTSVLTKYKIEAMDGVIGTINDLLFDDVDWAFRWLVVDVGKWLPGRKVLLPPTAVRSIDIRSKSLSVGLSRSEVESAPNLEEDAPVSQQHQAEIYAYYGWQPYWVGYATPFAMPPLVAIPETAPDATTEREPLGDPHLRSVREVLGYHLHAKDGEIGHIEDFLMDEKKWRVRYLVIDTRNWLPGRKVIVSPRWVDSIGWEERQLKMTVSREQVENSPEYDPSATLERAYEERLHSYYGFRPIL